ncbi:MAG: hypothetical protein EOP33_03460 [Rickettsiaceae bacterium]|nr:MAG: hypothetical protein EOP33_03460 [Rickettsiaceae bacterium]
MARNKKLKERKINKITETLKANDPLVENNDSSLTDPFSFAAKNAIENSREMIKDAQNLGASILNEKKPGRSKNTAKAKTSDKNSFSHSEEDHKSSDKSESSNPSHSLINKMFTSINSTMNKTLEQNSSLMQDAIKCKDAKDMLSLQQKMMETNFNNMMTLCLDMNFAIQAFVSKTMQASSDKTNKHMKCFTGEII